MQFHAVMADECGGEFGVTFDAPNHEAAWENLRDNYPESRCIQLENPEDTARREQLMQQRISWEMDNPGCEGSWYPGIDDPWPCPECGEFNDADAHECENCEVAF